MSQGTAKRSVKCKSCGLTINAECKGKYDPATRANVHEQCPVVDPDLQEAWKLTLEIMMERMKEGKDNV